MLQELKEKQNTVCLSRPRTILFCFPLRTEQAESQGPGEWGVKENRARI